MSIEDAQLLAMIDLDASLFVEYDDATKEPIALIETAQDTGQYKCATVTKNLARRANLPCCVVLYTKGIERNPGDRTQFDITSFRVRRLFPPPETDWKRMSPSEWASALLRMRRVGAKVVDELLGSLVCRMCSKVAYELDGSGTCPDCNVNRA